MAGNTTPGRRGRIDWGVPSPAWLAYGATALGLLVGFLIKNQCVVHAWVDNFQYRRLCYNDIQPLWAPRGIRDGLVPYRDVQLEYPVLSGLFMDLAGRLLRVITRSPSDGSYFVLSAALLAPLGFVVTGLLRPVVPARRLMIWAVGTPIVLYGFMNWDLLVVAAATWGLTAFGRKRDGWSGIALAAGASAKLYPLFFVPALVLQRLAARDRRGAYRLVGGFAVAYLLINLPWVIVSNGSPHASFGFALAHPDVPLREAGANGWLGIWLFHARRLVDYDTVWYWVAHHGQATVKSFNWGAGYQKFVSLTGIGLFGLGAGWLLWQGWRRRVGEAYPVVAICLGILCVFLLTSKFYSPQYALWLASLMAVVGVPWLKVGAFLAADLAVFVSRFNFYIVSQTPKSNWMTAFELSVWLRAGALMAIIAWVAFSCPPEIFSRQAKVFSQPG
ncbi:MAG: glycosyltransferase 87 family protein [Actinomycetota bacterium]